MPHSQFEVIKVEDNERENVIIEAPESLKGKIRKRRKRRPKKSNLSSMKSDHVLKWWERKVHPRLKIHDNGFPDDEKKHCWILQYDSITMPKAARFPKKLSVSARNLTAFYFGARIPDRKKKEFWHSKCTDFKVATKGLCVKPKHLYVYDSDENNSDVDLSDDANTDSDPASDSDSASDLE